jgi:hypothetical protein
MVAVEEKISAPCNVDYTWEPGPNTEPQPRRQVMKDSINIAIAE